MATGIRAVSWPGQSLGAKFIERKRQRDSWRRCKVWPQGGDARPYQMIYKIVCTLMLLLLCGAVPVLPSQGGQGSPSTMFPLESGNQWLYETQDGRYSFVIRVGLPAYVGGKTYFIVNSYGYGNAPWNQLMVRQAEDGALHVYDDETQQDLPLTLFQHIPGAWFASRLGACEDEGQVQPEPEPWNFGSTNTAAATVIRYRNFRCADNGLERETYVENLGLVQRVLTTFQGPMDFRLTYARIGNLTYRNGASASLSLDLDRSHVARPVGGSQDPVRIHLRYSVGPHYSGKLRFRSGQRYDVALLNAAGNEVWRWSDTEAFIQPIEEVTFGGYLEYSAYLQAHKFPDGEYTIQGWLNTDSERQLTVSIPFTISTTQPAESAARSANVRETLRIRPSWPQR